MFLSPILKDTPLTTQTALAKDRCSNDRSEPLGPLDSRTAASFAIPPSLEDCRRITRRSCGHFVRRAHRYGLTNWQPPSRFIRFTCLAKDAKRDFGNVRSTLGQWRVFCLPHMNVVDALRSEKPHDCLSHTNSRCGSETERRSETRLTTFCRVSAGPWESLRSRPSSAPAS
jgi:hypothetical protein